MVNQIIPLQLVVVQLNFPLLVSTTTKYVDKLQDIIVTLATNACNCFSKVIDSYCVDGVSITCGQNPCTHIWTYINKCSEDRVHLSECPCNICCCSGRNVASTFIGNHYCCKSCLDPGKQWMKSCAKILWGCKNCDSYKAFYCNSNVPWFYRLLDDITQDDIEMRVLYIY